jgi:hypothetical protein
MYMSTLFSSHIYVYICLKLHFEGLEVKSSRTVRNEQESERLQIFVIISQIVNQLPVIYLHVIWCLPHPNKDIL